MQNEKNKKSDLIEDIKTKIAYNIETDGLTEINKEKESHSKPKID